MTGLKAFLTGALLFAGTATTQAVPTLDITLIQDNWSLTLEILERRDGETLFAVLDNGAPGDSRLWSPMESTGGSVIFGDVGEFPFFAAGDHTIEFHYSNGFTTTASYTVMEPIGPAPVPDGGATASLLAVCTLGIFGVKRHLNVA